MCLLTAYKFGLYKRVIIYRWQYFKGETMGTFLIAFFVLLFIMTIMAVGVLMGRKPISGSCGGVGAALGKDDYVCELCGNDEAKCEEITENAKDNGSSKSSETENSFYDADKKRPF